MSALPRDAEANPTAPELEVDRAAAAVRARIGDREPAIGVVLGSGLGGLADRIDDAVAIPYADLPYFPRSTAAGHAGRLLVGELRGTGRTIAAMQGRFHLYEGWTARQAAFYVPVLARLGVRTLVVSNAAGGISPRLAVGDVVLIKDHLNLLFDAPLAAAGEGSVRGSRPCPAPYDEGLICACEIGARRAGFVAPRGVYAAMLGPTYETRAEVRMLRRLGADLAGMSTVPEVVAAAQSGMRVVGVSTVTNLASPDAPLAASHDEVVAVAGSTAEKLRVLVEVVVAAG